MDIRLLVVCVSLFVVILTSRWRDAKAVTFTRFQSEDFYFFKFNFLFV
jgi:hypothetical protein